MPLSAPRLPTLVALFAGLGCVSVVVEADPVEAETGSETTEGSSGDGDGDSSGDGDGDGDGDGEPSGDGDGEPMPPATFRVAVIADLHIPGPGYDGDDPNVDMARDRLLETRDKIAAIDPAPDFVVVIGDLTHEAYGSDDPLWYQTEPNAFADVADILAGFPMPVYPLFGESDYGVPETTKPFSHLIFAQTFALDPYYSVEHLGWRFIFANSQLGQTFDEGTLIYDPSKGSFGDAQLNWIRAELDADLPSVLFTHFPLFDVQANENEGAYADIEAAIAGADRLALILAGHGHTWSELPATYAAPHIGFGATHLDSDNFLLFEFTTAAFQYSILDKNKADWDGQGAETWVYEGEPAPG